MADPESSSSAQLVVVGSSAGGIEALSTLVSTLPTSFPAPIVIAQHLDPNRPSHLGEILARRSTLPVVSVQDHESLKPGTVYVVPAQHIEITERDIRLLLDGAGRPKPSVDLLLTTASEVYGDRLIAVILTGTGSDGSAGARAVKQAGGTVVIQNPDTAAYPGMPGSLAPNLVDVTANIERIGPIIFDLLTGVAVPGHPEAEREIGPLLDNLREHTGMDFRPYKSATILRRLQRRIVATESGDLAGYTNYLEAHPDEYQRLANSFLIKVTEFMRDPELFDALRDRILPELIAESRERDNELRFWSAGCATGEEAYSLAILVCEALGEELPNFNVKIFATDLDADAVAFARRGLYPADALSGLADDLVGRCFIKSNGGYEVKKKVRSLIVFGEHDLGQRAPFPRIDLVLCRNVLIYFTRELQQHALKLFTFALRDGGYLVLGRTETVSALAAYFTAEEKQLRVYRRKEGLRPPAPLKINVDPVAQVRAQQSDPRHRRLAARELFQAQQEAVQARTSKTNLLQNLPVGVVVVDGRYDIHEINNAARRLLMIFGPAVGEDLVHLAQHVPHAELRKAIDQAIKSKTVSTLDEIPVPQLASDETSYLQIACHPQESVEEGRSSSLALLLISDCTQDVLSRHELQQANARQLALTSQLTQAVTDLKTANAGLAIKNGEAGKVADAHEEASLQAESVAKRHAQQVEHLAATNATLPAANEELTNLNTDLSSRCDDFLVTNEEAQAAMEEAETLNEEMQASNEELETLNEELQATIEELNTSNSDLAKQSEELQELTVSLESQKQHSEREKAQLEAILTGIADAVLVVNSDGKPLMTNAAYGQLFGASDSGESREVALADEKGILLPAHATPRARAGKGETFTMTFAFTDAAGNPRWCEAIGKPVQGNDADSRWGVVVIRDITERSLRLLQEEFLALANHELRTPLTSIIGYVQLLITWLKTQPDNQRPLRSATIALSQAWRLTGLVNDLLDVSRLQSDKFRLRLAPIELDTLLRETVELGQALAKDQEIVLNLDGAAGGDGSGDGVEKPVTVQGDAERLQQVMLNLLTNAMTHAPSSKRIDVRLRSVDGMAEIEVQDYGEGIQADHLPNIFSRFFQVIQGTPFPGQGLGLGLFLSQEIVAAHGGTISVASTIGDGATFTIQMPLLL